MSNFFFGQNVYRISTNGYNIFLTVHYPWTLSREQVSFKLMQGVTQIDTSTVTFDADLKSEQTLFSSIDLSPGQYRIQVNKAGYNGNVVFTITENTTKNLNLVLYITELSNQNTMFDLIMNNSSDAKTKTVSLFSQDAKGNIDTTIEWMNPDSLENKMWLPNFSAALIKGNVIGELRFTIDITLDAISNNHVASVFLQNNRGESVGFNGSNLTFTFDTNNFNGTVSFEKFFSDINKLILYIQLNERV